MNSVRDFQKLEQDNALQKAKSRVIEVLSNEPFGLRIEQLTSMCRISAKTAKNILNTMDGITFQDGMYMLNLPDRVEVKPTTAPAEPEESEEPEVMPAGEPKADPEVQPVAETKPVEINRNVQSDILALLKDFEDGLSTEEILATLKISGKQFHNAMWNIRKEYTVHSWRSHNTTMFKFVDYVPMAKQENKAAVKAIMNEPVVTHTAPSVFDDLKQMIQTSVVKQHVLQLSQEQINQALLDAFGFDQIEWSDHAVTLTKVEVA